MMLKDVESIPTPARDRDDALLAGDVRWLLVQRILSSVGFQRAGQLRKILIYISASAILHPEEGLREYQIACEVLGRRSDFDPVSDNIVRAQMSHLRRKLETYYLEEGQTETLRLSIPKGSYHPQFHEVPLPFPVATTQKPEAETSGSDSLLRNDMRTSEVPQAAPWTRREIVLTVTGVSLFAIVALLSWMLYRGGGAKPPATPAGNAFVKFLHRSPGNVTVVLPDTSFMLMQQLLHTELSAQEYAQSDYLLREIDAVKDPALQDFLSQLRAKRNTSIGETIVATDLLHALSLGGVPTSLRYARDLHVRDLNEGSTILIGSHRSNPWNSLFNEHMNFRFHQDPVDHIAVFQNLHPFPGEQTRYVPYERQGGKMSSYIDVALTTNPTSSGYILLFDGSDSPAIEAAAHFLLHGKLPLAIEDLLSRDDLTYFEIFLRGVHTDADGEETFEVVGVRSASK